MKERHSRLSCVAVPVLFLPFLFCASSLPLTRLVFCFPFSVLCLLRVLDPCTSLCHPYAIPTSSSRPRTL